MSLDGRKVQLVRMHAPIQVHSIGQLGPTLDDQQKGKLKMVLCDRGVLVTGTVPPGRAESGQTVEFLVPDEMCTVIQFEQTNGK
jgi:hypothetical protein